MAATAWFIGGLFTGVLVGIFVAAILHMGGRESDIDEMATQKARMLTHKTRAQLKEARERIAELEREK